MGGQVRYYARTRLGEEPTQNIETIGEFIPELTTNELFALLSLVAGRLYDKAGAKTTVKLLHRVADSLINAWAAEMGGNK